MMPTAADQIARVQNDGLTGGDAAPVQFKIDLDFVAARWTLPPRRERF